jgi:hypothetical protein
MEMRLLTKSEANGKFQRCRELPHASQRQEEAEERFRQEQRSPLEDL